MNNVIKNNINNINMINFQNMKFCQIIEPNNYIQNYDSDTISDTISDIDSNSDSASVSYYSYSSSSSFSPVSLNSNNTNSINSTNSTNSLNSLSSLDEENNYWLRPYSAKFRSRLKTQTETQTPTQTQKPRQNPIQISNVYGVYNKNPTSEHTSGLDKDCPFIENLINKRINSCIVGPSSHIAAFLPSTVEIRSCFIPSWKRKGRNR